MFQAEAYKSEGHHLLCSILHAVSWFNFFKTFGFVLFYASLTSVKLSVGVFCIRIFVTLVLFAIYHAAETKLAVLSNVPLCLWAISTSCVLPCNFVQYG